jgi:outer membrane protein assembly factor BamE
MGVAGTMFRIILAPLLNMLSHPRTLASCVAAGAVLALAGCASNSSVSNPATWLTPYKVEVIQGNFVSKEQVQALRPGMSRSQVRDILGTPLITSAFHAERWDYSFTLRRQGVAPQQRKLVLFFKGEALEKFEGDEMPLEAEFVRQVDRTRPVTKAPNLQASEEQLRAAQGRDANAAAATSNTPPATANPSAPRSYPPLETPAQ